MTHHPTAHLLYMSMAQINKQLNTLPSAGPDKSNASINKPMQEKYNKYWQEMQDFSGFALLFDPRYKLVLVEFLLSDFFGTKNAKIKEKST